MPVYNDLSLLSHSLPRLRLTNSSSTSRFPPNAHTPFASRAGAIHGRAGASPLPRFPPRPPRLQGHGGRGGARHGVPRRLRLDRAGGRAWRHSGARRFLPAQRADVQRRFRAEEAAAGGGGGGGRVLGGSQRGPAPGCGAGACTSSASGQRAGKGGGLRHGVHKWEGGQWRRRPAVAGTPVEAVPPRRGDRRARKTREREDARGAGGGPAEARPGAGRAAGRRGARRVGAPARGGGRARARAPPQRGARGGGPADGGRVPGVDERRHEPRGRRRRPPRHTGPAPPILRRRRPRGRGRGRAVVLLRGAGRGRGRRRRVQGHRAVVQGVRRRRRVRAAAPVPAPVPLPRVRGRRGRVPRLRRRQERLAPCSALLKSQNASLCSRRPHLIARSGKVL